MVTTLLISLTSVASDEPVPSFTTVEDCHKHFKPASKAFRLCLDAFSFTYISNGVLEGLRVQLQEIVSISKNNEIKASEQEELKNSALDKLEVTTVTLASLRAELKKIEGNFDEYRWQTRMKTVVPILLGVYAANNSGASIDDQKLWVHFFSGVGLGFTADYAGLPVSDWLGTAIYNGVNIPILTW